MQIEELNIQSELLTRWDEYELHEYHLKVNNRHTPYKLIMKQSKPVAIVTSRYKLLPNEEALKVADEIALEMGAVKFNEFRGRWYARTGNHVLYNRRKTQMHSLYAFNEPVQIAPDDTIQLGFSIHNSIDGTMGFGAGTFTFRNACANMFMMGFKGHSMNFDDRLTLAYIYHKHTKNMEVARDKIKSILQAIVNRGMEVVATYRAMTERKITEQNAKKIAESLPKVAVQNAMPYFDAKDMTLKAQPTEWTVFNDTTQWIWHNPKTQLETKLRQMKAVEQILVVR